MRATTQQAQPHEDLGDVRLHLQLQPGAPWAIASRSSTWPPARSSGSTGCPLGDVLLCGQTGVGKSHLAQAVAHEAARQGAAIVFTTVHQMLLQLQGGRADGTDAQRLARYTKPDLLVLDDFGLKPLPPSGPADRYDVIDDRYERRSIVLTSNRAPHEWPELFANPLLANAALDRLAHRAIVVTITGRSYRLAQRADGKEVALFEPPSLATATATTPKVDRRASHGPA